MFNKTIVATALLGLGLAASAQAADPTANVLFRGLVGNSIPGDNLIITGNNGGEIGTGVLLVDTDGTFETITPVQVEARDYTPADDTAGTAEIIGDVVDTSVWKVTSITTLFGSDPSSLAEVKVTDTGSNGVTGLETLNTTSTAGGELSLNVTNTIPATDVEDYNVVTVSVALTANSGV